jgi:hypothetical protein
MIDWISNLLAAEVAVLLAVVIFVIVLTTVKELTKGDGK